MREELRKGEMQQDLLRRRNEENYVHSNNKIRKVMEANRYYQDQLDLKEKNCSHQRGKEQL